MYPTAAKLVAALLFAALAWWVSDLLKPNLPRGTPVTLLSPVNAAIGFLMGWRVMGIRAGRGYVAALGYGWTTAGVIVLWGLVIWGGVKMLQRSMDMFYDGPVEALEAGVGLMLDYATYFLAGPVLPSLVVGAAFCAVVTEWVALRTIRR